MCVCVCVLKWRRQSTAFDICQFLAYVIVRYVWLSSTLSTVDL